VNASPVDVAAGASALECVRAWRGDEGEAIRAGRRIITDSRGLPVASDTPVSAGSIFRTVSARRERDDD